MEVVIGPLLALVIGIKYSDFKNKKSLKELESFKAEINGRIESVETDVTKIDKEILKKTLQVVLPIAQATERLQTAVGVK